MIGGQRNDKNGWNCIGICVEQVFSIYLSVYWRLYYTMSLYLSCEMEGRIGRGESLLLRIDHDGVFFFLCLMLMKKKISLMMVGFCTYIRYL